MSFVTNECQQLNLSDKFYSLSKRTEKFVRNSWAKGFAEIIFPAINERRFSVLYSNNKASRPNSPVNVIVGSLILKEMLGLSDEELLASILCDIRFQYALHTTSFNEQPVSDRTFSRFRERLYLYELETGEDLMKQEMESLAELFLKYLNINPSIKRMDSVMVSSSCKKMSRLEILYTCVANMVKTIHQTGETEFLGSMEHYLNEDDLNKTIYHRKGEEITSRLEQVIKDAKQLITQVGDAYSEMPVYQLLCRVLSEQTEKNEEGNIVPKDKRDIKPTSMQNPSDPDATYRKKAGKDHKGYVGNFVETFDENGSIITNFDYQTNNHSDSSFCKEIIEELGSSDEKVTLLADGAYGGIENTAEAAENNIELVTTALTGSTPDVIMSDFEIDTKQHKVQSCPMGHKPYKCRYYEATDSYRVSFNKNTCNNCPNKEKCRAKFQKKSAVVMLSTKTVQRAKYLKKLSTEEYRLLARKRNGVEGIPSILRRKYNVDHIPVRGHLRSKLWFTMKIGTINVKRVLARVAFPSKNVSSKGQLINFPKIYLKKITLNYQVA